MDGLKERIIKLSGKEYRGNIKATWLDETFGKNTTQEVQNQTINLARYSISVRLYCYLNDIDVIPNCKICNKETGFNTSTKKCKVYCSNDCRFKDIKDIFKKTRKTNLERYGAENVFGGNIIKEKILQTNLNRYGVTNYTKTTEYKTFAKGRKCLTSGIKTSKIILDKAYQQLKVKYPTIMPMFAREEYLGASSYNIEYQWLCKECQHIFTRWLNNNYPLFCPKCKPIGTKNELKIKGVLDKHHIDYVYRDRKILDNLELDFYIPSKGLAIEINGLYWHSEKCGTGKNYHSNKTDQCDQKKIKLIQIFEDEILCKEKIVFNRLKKSLGLITLKIYARKCVIKEITYNQKTAFINKYHIQGDAATSVNLGIFYKNRLVAVMTFSSLRKSLGSKAKEGSFELVRFCTVSNFNVIGAAGKMIQYFIKKYQPKCLISYADRRWSNGDVYYKTGFVLDSITPPNYWYTKNYLVRLHRFAYQKHLLETKLKTFDPKLTENANMIKNGYTRIWDCGHLKFVITFNNRSHHSSN